MKQVSVFEFLEEPKKEKSTQQKFKERDDFLKKYAFLYCCSRGGPNTSGSSKIFFAMKYDDAMEFCQDPSTKGSLYGYPWIYMFTSFYNYLIVKDSCYQVDKITVDLSNVFDDGRFDKLCETQKWDKYSPYDIKQMLQPYGIEVICSNPPKERLKKAKENAKDLKEIERIEQFEKDIDETEKYLKSLKK